MTLQIGFPYREMDDEFIWIIDQCRAVATPHMALANKAEQLMNRFLHNRRFRSRLRTLASHHRR